MSKEIKFSNQAREQLLAGVQKLSNAVTATLGPNGRNVIIEQKMGNPTSTKDGVTVAKSIELEDTVENIGAQLVKQASIKTADQAGDGTTTSTLLTYSILAKGMDSLEKANAVEVKRGIDIASREVVDAIQILAEEVTSEDQLRQVATISANNDVEVGELIASAMDKVGTDGVITIEESRTGETYLETVEGMQFNRGYKSPYFVTDNNSMNAVLSSPLVLITDKKLTQAKELLPILEACSSQSKSLLIIADDVDGEALSTLVVNKMRGILNVVAVKAPEFGERKKAILEDIAVLTDGQVVSSEKGMRLDKFNPEWLGSARKVTVSKDDTTIIDGNGSEESISQRTEEIKALIDSTNSPYEKETLQDRLGRLIGGVAIVHVGGHTELEMKEKKDRVDDALHATKAAIEEGILPGGGKALLQISENLTLKLAKGNIKFEHRDQIIGYNILIQSIREPFIKILVNAGYEIESIAEILTKVLDEDSTWYGYSPRDKEYVDMFKKGIVDPAKVTRLALENAASIAGTMLITECVVSNIKDESNDRQMDLSQFGM